MKYRFVHVSFWQDSEVLDLTPEQKYFFLYLLTNPHTTQVGIYEVSKKLMAFETGYHIETIEKLINAFTEMGKIHYDPETSEIFVVNWIKYNWSNSPKVIRTIIKDLENVKSKKLLVLFWNSLSDEIRQVFIDYGYTIDSVLIDYPYSMDRLPEKEKEKEKEKQKEKENIYRDDSSGYFDTKRNLDTSNDVPVDSKESTTSPPQVPYQKIVDLYHKYCPSLPKVVKLSDTRKKYIRARWKEYPELQFWEQFFKRVEASDFLTGRADYGNRKPFIADFEWLVRPSNFLKVLEGKYDNRSPTKRRDDLEEILKKEFRKAGMRND